MLTVRVHVKLSYGSVWVHVSRTACPFVLCACPFVLHILYMPYEHNVFYFVMLQMVGLQGGAVPLSRRPI